MGRRATERHSRTASSPLGGGPVGCRASRCLALTEGGVDVAEHVLFGRAGIDVVVVENDVEAVAVFESDELRAIVRAGAVSWNARWPDRPR